MTLDDEIRKASAAHDRIFQVSYTVDRATTRKGARALGLSEGGSHVHLGRSTASRGGAEQVELRDCLSTHSGEGGWFRGTESGCLSVQTGNDPIKYTALETVIAGEIVAATRDRFQ
ncbi:hypothetical protein [Umezawaea tangerina]|uniref:Uncharacterized protein n=1 Tax=Umezawaea tangerina TaxID=84725 RepID=A0A2T0SZY6_9PSEU|nr:hypothetical protein [Umezawaea tangerina]PRY38982.1 hypothetical protein CLV43_108382 [Umezawaea tangerina]